jgi:hypothetical protein
MLNPQVTHAFAVGFEGSIVLQTGRESMARRQIGKLFIKRS